MNDDSMQPVTVILDAEVDRLARRAKLQARIDRLREATPEALGQLATMLSAADLPSLKRSDDHTPTQLDRIGEMIATLERNHPVPFDPELDGTPSPAPEPRPVRDMVEVAPRRAPIVDVADGTIGAEDVAAINTARHHLNDEGRAWFKERVNESIRSGQPPHMGGNDGVMCARRFEVACALVAGARYVTAAGSVAAVSECNELIRSACILAGEPLAAQPAFDLGNVIGHMDAATARRLTELIDGLTASDPKICGMVLAAVA